MASFRWTRAVALTTALSQVWKMEDADQPHWNRIFWDSADDVRQFPELALFKDFTFTENPRCGIKTGVWHVNKEQRQLILQYKEGGGKIYFIRQVAKRGLKLEWAPDPGVGARPAIIGLSAEALVHKRAEDDPYYPANNRWRIKPASPETPEQIHARLKGYVHFYSLFFRDNRQRQEKEISFSGFPACLVWYNGGIGMPDRKEMDGKWVGCFYSREQADKGYGILEAILAKHDLKWPEHPTSWIKQTYEVLDQIFGKL